MKQPGPTPLLCVSICEPNLARATESSIRASGKADLIEIRLDCLDNLQLQGISGALAGFLDRIEKPVILTLRPADEGGPNEISPEKRLDFWALANKTRAQFLDIEAAFLPALIENSILPDWSRVISSHHDFAGVPSDLLSIYERMKTSPARILKIAVQAEDVTDCLAMFELIDQAGRDNREIIAIAMGQSGVATRILGPSRGAFLTYGALEAESATAPGQLTIGELRDTYRIERVTRKTEIMGIVGRPTNHSISPHMHNAAFAAAGIDAIYLPFEVTDLASFMSRMVDPKSRKIDWSLKGLSITAPHKTETMKYLDWVEPAAKEIGAVNTVVLDDNGLRGYNTDGVALVKPLLERVGTLAGTRCAVAGTGGVARTAVWVLQREGAHVTVFGRDLERARSLANELGASWSDLENSSFNGFEVVINATPLGTKGSLQFESVANAQQLRGARLVYDLVYNPKETQLLREAKIAGCETLGGIDMLVNQALAQFRLWTGQDPPADVMIAAAERALQEQSSSNEQHL